MVKIIAMKFKPTVVVRYINPKTDGRWRHTKLGRLKSLSSCSNFFKNSAMVVGIVLINAMWIVVSHMSALNRVKAFVKVPIKPEVFTDGQIEKL